MTKSENGSFNINEDRLVAEIQPINKGSEERPWFNVYCRTEDRLLNQLPLTHANAIRLAANHGHVTYVYQLHSFAE